MRIKPLLLAGLIAFLQYFSNAQKTTQAEVLTNKSIIELHKAGIDEDIIVAKIQSSECKFDLTTNGMIDLKNKGVPSNLIKVMMNKADGKPLNYAGSDSSKDLQNLKPDKNKTSPKFNYPSLDLLNYVYSWNKSSQSAKQLEKSTAVVRHQPGLIKAHDYWHLEGVRSSVRISTEEATEFLINTGNTTPPELILYKLNSVKNNREAIYVTGTITGNKASSDMITVNISKAAEGIYQVVPGIALKKGEYFFTIKPAGIDALSVDAYSFGID